MDDKKKYETINELLDKYHNINVRISVLKDEARKIKDQIVMEVDNESRLPNTSK